MRRRRLGGGGGGRRGGDEGDEGSGIGRAWFNVSVGGFADCWYNLR